ncbi:YL1 nuclear domain-containing protein [Trichoderma sp. SZMC 28014]
MSTMDPESAQQSESQLSAPPPLSDLDSSSDSSDSEAEDSSKAASRREPQPVEWLATSRSRRSTAGNRMKSMLANEEPDSDLELLFAEDEDDQGFTDAGDDASDVQMDSSSDDEGDNNAGDELEGEQELERQARERRAAQRKRKAQEAIPAKFRKKVRIHPAASESSTPAPVPRPKKKSERTSWLPSPADLPTRASSRKTTRMSKEQLHQQMIEREERRLKQLEQMQKKAARMEALKKPPMTQQDRLREAAIVEKRNSKSLNRWEVAEKQREEERRAKLAALNQRTLKGPVITFWTGLGEARRVVIEEEKPKRKRVDKKDKDKDKGKGAEAAKDGADVANMTADKDVKESIAPQQGQQQTDASTKMAVDDDNATAAAPKPDAAETQSKEEPASTTTPPVPAVSETKTADAEPPLKQEDDEKTGPPSSQPPAAPATTAASSSIDPLSPTASTAKPPGDVQPAQPVIAAPLLSPPPPSSGLAAPASASPLSAPPRQTSPLAAPTGVGSPRPLETGKPSGVLALPVLAPPPAMNVDYRPGPAPKSNVLALPNASLPQSALAPLTQIQPPGSTTVATHVSTEPVFTNTVLRPIIPEPEQVNKTASPSLSEPPPQPTPAPADAPETTTRNVIIFQNFDENAIQDRSIQTQILFGRKMNKLSKPAPAPICVITGLPARYKDPKTGLPYHNVAAYRELERLGRKELSWSALLNAWVGSEKTAARGVPARFLDPNAPTKTPEEREKERLAQIRAVPPQPQPPPVQQHHQAPPAAVVAAAHKAPQTQHHVQHQQLRAPQPFQAPQQPYVQHQQLARPQQPQSSPPQLQPPQQLPNRPSPNPPPPPQKQQQPISNTTPIVPPSQTTPPQASPPQPSPLPATQQQPTPTPPPPATQSPIQKTTAHQPPPAAHPAPEAQFQAGGEATTTSGPQVAPVEKEPLPTTTAAPE